MRSILRQLLGSATRLGAIGLLGVGVSGVVAAIFGAIGGKAFVAGDPPGVSYTRARCADFFEYAPRAHSCEQAATIHHFGEVVNYRIAAGVLGVILLAGIALLRRRHSSWLAADRLPTAFDETVAVIAFGGAGTWLLGFGVDQAAQGYQGSGTYLSGGIVAALAAIWLAARFLRKVAATPPPEARWTLAGA